MIFRIALTVTMSVILTLTARAAPIETFQIEGVDYDPAITTPDDFIGYGLGDKPVRHDIMVGYLRTLARQSPRIMAETIGKTHEGRPILSLVISSPDNLENIETIKEQHKARLSGEAAANNDGPVVVWLNYGVHGAESAGMDAAIPTLYHYAAAQGEEIDALLKDTVIVMIAIFNPDGHSRRINHVYTFDGTVSVTDRNHVAHNLWIEARTNHYWFDLNRDWLLLTQPEARAWIKTWHDWKPNVSADFHEMGSDSTYYFHPGEPKRKNPLIPERARELLSTIAEGHADYLDGAGELYTSEEGFDNFYIGKGSTYPSINGSVGILFEAAAARGGEVETENGIRTYDQNIRIHFNTSLTTVSRAYKNREALLSYQRSFFSDALRKARADERKAFVFSAGDDEARAAAFVRLLKSHAVDVFHLGQDLEIDGQTFPTAQSFIVPTSQRQYTMIRGIFDTVTEFEEAIFYDVSGWTLPLAYDLNLVALDAFRAGRNLIGDPVGDLTVSDDTPERGRYGYIFSWADYYAPRALYRFMEAGAKPRVLLREKTLVVGDSEKTFPAGSIFIPANTRLSVDERIDGDVLFDVAKKAASLDGVEIHGLSSGNASPGVGDLGSRGSVGTIRMPRLLLLFDDYGTRYGAGQLWHLIDHKMEIPVTLMRLDVAEQIDLDGYTHILLPGSRRPVNDALSKKLEGWARAGGTLVATKQAALQMQKAWFGEGENNGEAGQTTNGDAEESGRAFYREKQVKDAEHLIGGALFESLLDQSHPIGFGFLDPSIATMKTMETPLLPAKDPYAGVALYAKTPLLSGYASDRRKSELAGTPSVVAERLGRGSVILFADDPAFRATFLGADRLVLNAVFFGDQFSSARLP